MNIGNCDIAVIGAGIVGMSVAYELVRRGAAVTLIAPVPYPSRSMGSTAAGAMLSLFSEIEPGQSTDRTTADIGERLVSARLWQSWLATLTERGARIQVDNGTWVVARPDERHALAAIGSAALRHGHAAEEHDADEVPGLSGCRPTLSDALWLPSESSVDSFDLISALHTFLDKHPQITWLDSTAKSVDVDGSRKTVHTTDGFVRARRVVLAAGVATTALIGSSRVALGVPVLVGGYGSGLLVRTPNPPRHAVRTVNRAFSCGTHLVPRTNGLTYIGSSNRFRRAPAVAAAAQTTLDEINVLTDAATSELDSSLFEAELVSTHSGVRPFTVDHLPLIGRTADPDILLATATYRSGYMLAPRIAEVVADQIQNPGTHKGHPYAVDRRFDIPETGAVLSAGGTGLLDALLEPGGRLPPGVSDRLTTFVIEALRTMLDGTENGEVAKALRELWNESPVTEAVPALLRLTQELKGRSSR